MWSRATSARPRRLPGCRRPAVSAPPRSGPARGWSRRRSAGKAGAGETLEVNVGDAAPDFELKDQHGAPVRLSDFRGEKNVVLVFYPLAFSGVCTGELC